MTNDTGAKSRRFGMHANLLYDVITKQAGTLQKAILEGVMNGVDAGASRLDITLSDKKLTISDDGRGFKDLDEIERFFETFGTPHQEGDAVYGRFRMGRGQLFAFGRNSWRTNRFRMNVDIKAKGLDYDLETVPEEHSGCQISIELYKQLLPSERDTIERELRQWVSYVSIPVILNGKTISQKPEDANWDVETDEAWFKLAPSKATLSVYNLGVLVMHAPASRYGTGGTVVSKHRLDVNFARNDVQDDCAIFKAIKAELRKHSDKNVVRKKRMTDHERQHLAERILDGTADFAKALDFPVVTDVEGRHLSLNALLHSMIYNKVLIVAQRGDRQAIKIAEQKLATAISTDTLERFSADSPRELIDALIERGQQALAGWTDPRHYIPRNFLSTMREIELRTTADFAHLVNDSYEDVPNKKLTPSQRRLLSTAGAAMWTIAAHLGSRMGRTLHAGHSDIADAWTDGVRHVWINVNKLNLIGQGYQGCAQIASILVHEYLHEGPDTLTHEHDLEFYQRFHDLVCDTEIIGAAVAAMMRYLAQDSRKRGRSPARRVALFEDNEATIKMEGGTGTPASLPDLSIDDEEEQAAQAA